MIKYAGMTIRQTAATGVDRKLVAGGDGAALHEASAFAFGTIAEVFQKQYRCDGERVVEREPVNVAGLQARRAKGLRNR
jgi:hypothetical protein